MKRLIGSFPVSVLLGLLFCAAGLRADPPTLTPTPTLSSTVTPTPTQGPGSYAYTVFNAQLTPQAPPFVVPGNAGTSLEIDYTVTSALSPGGVLVFQFPSDIGGALGVQPASTFITGSFYPQPAYQSNFYYAISGLYVSVTANTTIPAGTVLQFTYGQGGTDGFVVPLSTTQSVESVGVLANTQEPPVLGLAGVGVVPPPAPILVWSATVSPTVTPSPTITQTFTPSPSFTPSPTATISATVTPSPTITPVGPVRAAIGFYTYPNPFDMRQQSCVTVRFPPTSEPVEITIFSLTGNPVCTVPAMAIQNFLGVAQWCGTDDYGRTVSGGLYFVRLKTPSQTWVHKMTVFH